jgi:hypothetical protein
LRTGAGLAGAKNVLRQAAASQAQESDTSLSLAKNRALAKLMPKMPICSRAFPKSPMQQGPDQQMADHEAAYFVQRNSRKTSSLIW